MLVLCSNFGRLSVFSKNIDMIEVENSLRSRRKTGDMGKRAGIDGGGSAKEEERLL